MSEAEVARDFPAVMRKLNGGAEIIIERGDAAVAVLRSAVPARRRISECIARLPANSTATIDPDFARDVDEAIACHREALEPPRWE